MPVDRPVSIAAASATFKKSYKKKSSTECRTVDETIKQMEADLAHRSLRVSHMSGGKGVWEARATERMRITFEFVDGKSIRLRNCCYHTAVYRKP